MQESVVSVRGQTVVPKEVREALGIEPGAKLKWRIRGGVAVVVPASYDPVRALRGVLKGKGSTEDLLRDRREERDKEERQLEEDIKRWRGELPSNFHEKPTERDVQEEIKRWRSLP